MKKKYKIVLFLIIGSLVLYICYHKFFINNKKTGTDKEFQFNEANYKTDKRISLFLDEYFNDEKLKNRNAYFMFIEENEKSFYITITSEIEKFQSSYFKPFASISWANKRIFILSNITNLFVSDNNDLVEEFRKSDIMNANNHYRKLWLLIIPIYGNSYAIIKDANKIHEILSPVEIVREE